VIQRITDSMQESAMGRPYSEDFRERVLGAIDNGENAYEIARIHGAKGISSFAILSQSAVEAAINRCRAPLSPNQMCEKLWKLVLAHGSSCVGSGHAAPPRSVADHQGIEISSANICESQHGASAVSGRMIVMALRTDGNQRYRWMKNRRSLFVIVDATAHLSLQHNS
jgi:hypothetical protein